jgi:hypothetical protein
MTDFVSPPPPPPSPVFTEEDQIEYLKNIIKDLYIKLSIPN